MNTFGERYIMHWMLHWAMVNIPMTKFIILKCIRKALEKNMNGTLEYVASKFI